MLLVSTDPASNLGQVFGMEIGDSRVPVPGVDRLHKSPCTEEVAVFHAFSHLVREAARRFVVVDTAPTDHTLLLLDQTGAYHREVVRNTSRMHGSSIEAWLRQLRPIRFWRRAPQQS